MTSRTKFPGSPAPSPVSIKCPPENVANSIVPLSADQHGQLHLLDFNLTHFEARLRGEDIIQGRQVITAPWTEKNAEFLGVPVRRANEPEEDVGELWEILQTESFELKTTHDHEVLQGWLATSRMTCCRPETTRARWP